MNKDCYKAINTNKNICIKEGVYRFDINKTKVLFNKEDGLIINNFKLENAEGVIKAIKEIQKYETTN